MTTLQPDWLAAGRLLGFDILTGDNGSGGNGCERRYQGRRQNLAKERWTADDRTCFRCRTRNGNTDRRLRMVRRRKTQSRMVSNHQPDENQALSAVFTFSRLKPFRILRNECRFRVVHTAQELKVPLRLLHNQVHRRPIAANTGNDISVCQPKRLQAAGIAGVSGGSGRSGMVHARSLARRLTLGPRVP